MNFTKYLADTIAAVSTARATAAISVIRVSGPQCLDVLRKVTSNRTKKWEEKPRRLELAWIVDANGHPLDQALVVYFPSPSSYTGEDMAEVHCHGGTGVTSAVLKAVIEAGARLAGAGEFTKRALLNGKIRLDDVDAISGLINARSEQEARLAARLLAGETGDRLERAAERMEAIRVELEGSIEFPEDIDPPEDAAGRLGEVEKELAEVLARWSRKSPADEKVVICGRTNVGKSTLANALSGLEMSIVTGHAGTTRDAVEKRVRIGGAEITLVDTAGLMDGNELEEIDAAAIRRTRQAIEEASVVMWVSEAGMLEEPDGKTVADLRVMNKVDLASRKEVESAKELGWICVSAKYGDGLDCLKDRLGRLLEERFGLSGGLPVSARRYDFLGKTIESLGRARVQIERGMLELASADLTDALESLYRVLGKEYDPDLLEEIFSGFCVGK